MSLNQNENWVRSKKKIPLHGHEIRLFVFGFSFHSRLFHLYGDVTIASERQQIKINAQHTWSLSSEGSFNIECHIYCDDGHSFMWSSTMIREIRLCCRAFGSEDVITCFNGLALSLPRLHNPTFYMRSEHSNQLRHWFVKGNQMR